MPPADARSDTDAVAPHGADQDPKKIQDMFGQITPTYDFLNHLLSGFLDRRWRARLAHELTEGHEPCRNILDVATGTGDLASAIARQRPGVRVVGLDFTSAMVRRAARKYGCDNFHWIEGDGLHLPFKSESFDAACIAFGLRNMVDREQGLAEMRRVTRPGGRIGILEFFQPPGPMMSRLYRFYSLTVVPRLGRWISRSDAYRYLPESIRVFWSPEQMRERMESVGIVRVRHHALARGIVGLHLGEIPQ